MSKKLKTIISFDTETTGLLKPEENPVSEQPRIIEFAAMKFDQSGNLLDQIELLINPGIQLPPVITKITGKTDRDLQDKPSFVEVFSDIASFFVGADILTAHNLAFDRDLLANELLRIDRVFNFPFAPMQICTVKSTLQLQGYRLNLTKLHNYLFGCDFVDAHSALGDVKAQSRCFFELVKRGDIKL